MIAGLIIPYRSCDAGDRIRRTAPQAMRPRSGRAPVSGCLADPCGAMTIAYGASRYVVSCRSASTIAISSGSPLA